MITTGIDLIEIARVQKCAANTRFVNRVYSAQEQALFSSKQNPLPAMAGNWAAKEAFSKALGTGVRDFSLNEISVLRDVLGAPYLALSGKAKAFAEERGFVFSVSITHTKQFAAAVVVAYPKELADAEWV